MQLLSRKTIALLAMVLTSSAVQAQDSEKQDEPVRSRYARWYGQGYFYGPDGGYSRLKNSKMSKSYANDFCYYEKNRFGTRTVFKRARYAEDICGRGYLYLADKENQNK